MFRENEKIKASYWITWEDHRRSRELASAIGAEYVCLLHSGDRYIRYPILSLKTIIFLFKTKPTLVFCQNPSIVLNTLLCLMKLIFRFGLITDRHSNFKFDTIKSRSPKWKLFHILSNFTLRKSNLTIVTNEYLKTHVDHQGGRGYILPDKLPSFGLIKKLPLKGDVNFVFISTFSYDEPIFDVVTAAKSLPLGNHVYITGGYKRYKKIAELKECLPANVTLTGFLPEDEYQSLLNSADIIIIITDQEYTLTCGAYEAVSLEKPMLLGNTETIKGYFSKGATYTALSERDISANMLRAIESIAVKKEEVIQLKLELQTDWEVRFGGLKCAIEESGAY